jgi:TolB protein
MRVAWVAWVAIVLVLIAAGSAGATQSGVEPPYADVWPAWSHDGSQIAFSRLAVTSAHNVRDASLYVANADGSQPRVLVQGDPANDVGHTNAADDPTWAPDGRRLAYTLAHQDNRYTAAFEAVHVINADGSGDHAITPVPAPGGNLVYSYQPSWSPTGGKIAFVPNGNIVVANEDGSAPTPLTTDGGSATPAWSPDGTKIAYGSRTGGRTAST